ncbi:MAG: winged helix-turn-helix transcriptional regulator [Methanoregula sp.]|nr:winged helix-turn-helix transcriptional regulator [Methanoregula sp.]
MRKHSPLVLLAVVLFLVLAAPVAAQEYVVQSGYESPVSPTADARIPVPVPFYALPLWVILAQLVFLPSELLLSLKLWAYLGIRQVSGGNVLDQDVRARIYGYIRLNPGIHLRGLSAEMHMKLGTLRYHLNVLRLNHKIAISEDNASVRFYENSGTYSTDEQQIHKHLRNETTKKILSVLLERPMATRQDIADAVGVTGPSVSWHMKRLEEDHLITARREGRMTAYEIPAPVVGYLSRQIRAPAGVPVQECPGMAGNA